MPRIVVTDGSSQRTLDLGDGALILGRAPDSGVVLDDKESSRHHAQIERFEGGWKVVDLESRNGTRVNGKTVNVHLLQHGDRIEIGKSVIAYEGDDAPRAAAPKPRAEPVPSSTPPAGRARAVGGRSTERKTVTRRRGDNREAKHQVLLRRTITISCVLGAFLVLWILYSLVSTKDPYEQRAQKLWKEARELELAKAYSDALKKLEDIPRESTHYYDLAQKEIVEIAKRQSAAAKAPPESPDRARYEEIVRFGEASPDEVTGFLEKVKEFRTQFPASPHHADLERLASDKLAAREARDLKLFDVVKVEIDGPLADRPIAGLHRLAEFLKANPSLSAKPRMMLEVRITTLQSRAQQWVEARKREAEAAGTPDEARKAWKAILDECGEDDRFKADVELAGRKIREIAGGAGPGDAPK